MSELNNRHSDALHAAVNLLLLGYYKYTNFILDALGRVGGPVFHRLDIILPLARPGLLALAIFTFLANYTSLFWPLIMIKSDHLRTLPIGMLYFDTVYGKQTNLLMAASVMNVLPLIVLFVFTQKFLVKGIQLGAVKG